MFVPVPIWQYTSGRLQKAPPDDVVCEAPLSIRIIYGEPPRQQHHDWLVMYRTPGHDAELAMGLAITSGLLATPGDLLRIRPQYKRNQIQLELQPAVRFDPKDFQQAQAGSSSCGICGRSSEGDACVADQTLPVVQLPAGKILELPAQLGNQQSVFARTGGLHACGWWDSAGELVVAREDIGRHNAVDKCVGALVSQQRQLPLGGLFFVSSRVGYEIAQKAIRAGVPVLAAVGPPSDLAIQECQEGGVTLIGFVRPGRYNVYTHPERLLAE